MSDKDVFFGIADKLVVVEYSSDIGTMTYYYSIAGSFNIIELGIVQLQNMTFTA